MEKQKKERKNENMIEERLKEKGRQEEGKERRKQRTDITQTECKIKNVIYIIFILYYIHLKKRERKTIKIKNKFKKSKEIRNKYIQVEGNITFIL